jgi:SAM-dependent methyltransferase
VPQVRSGNRTIGLSPGSAESGRGQDEVKYESRNPVVRRLVDRWLRRLEATVGDASGVAVDVGVGEGYVAARLASTRVVPVGIDYRLDKLAVARTRCHALRGIRGDAGMLPVRDASADLVVCTEVLEHLTRPEDAVTELARITRVCCVVSVPWEPLFRLGNLARGKYLKRLGNYPEHVQGYSARRLQRELERRFTDVRVNRCFPWLIATAANPQR